jgi:hypothetical protein
LLINVKDKNAEHGSLLTMEISGTGLSAGVNAGGNWDLQKMCSLWEIQVSWDVMLLGVTNPEYT